MKIYLMLFSPLFFIACNNHQNKNADSIKKDTVVNTVHPDELILGTPAFTALPFDKGDQTFKDSIKGTLVDGLHWRDAEAEHRVLFTAMPVGMDKKGLQSGAVYAYCFWNNGGNWQKKWEVKDRIEACEVDATCEFFSNSFAVTDNDGNGVAEVSFLYKLSCRGDVSPDEKKLIMYEGTNKYAIRGTTILQYQGIKEGGDKKIDVSFNKAAKPLLDFANSQWDKFGTTKY